MHRILNEIRRTPKFRVGEVVSGEDRSVWQVVAYDPDRPHGEIYEFICLDGSRGPCGGRIWGVSEYTLSSSWRPPDAEWWKTAPKGLLVRTKHSGISGKLGPVPLVDIYRIVYTPTRTWVVRISDLALDTPEDEI